MDDTTPRRRSPSGPASLAAVAMLLAVVDLAAQWNIDGNRRIDYRIYVRAVSSIDGAGLYDYGTGILRFTYPPVAAALVWPFTWLDEAVGSRVWLTLSVVAFVVAYAVAIHNAGSARPVPPTVALVGGAVALWLAPAISTLRLGQVNAFVALLLCVDSAAIARRSRWSGLGIGLAAAIKVTPLAVFPVLWFGLRRHDRVVAWRAAATFAAVTGTTAAVAPGATWEFVQRLGGRAVNRAASTSVDLRVLLRSAIDTRAVADTLWLVAAAVLVAAALRTAARLGRSARPDGIGLVTVGMCLSTVVSPFSSVHHLTFATVAVVLWAARSTSSWQRAVAVAGLLALLDPTAGEGAPGRWAMVAFCIVTVVVLPGVALAPIDPDFVETDRIPQDVNLLQGGH